MIGTLALTTLALLAFAANALLCRLALGEGLIDPVSFTTIRIAGGACALAAVSGFLGTPSASSGSKHGIISAIALFAYALCFSLAYEHLSAGTGALILYGAVQCSMLGRAVAAGERIGLWRWLGFALAVVGLVTLAAPGLSAPNLSAAALMALAGVAWGVYSLIGRVKVDPVASTAGAFLYAVPFAVATSIISLEDVQLQMEGVMLALVSGVATSALAYVVWYQALKQLSRTEASVAQLLVPIVAAAGGITFLSEELTLRFLVAAGMVVGGVALTLARGLRNKEVAPKTSEPLELSFRLHRVDQRQ